MAHDTGAGIHAEQGAEGAAMAWIHKGARKAAQVAANLPFIVAFVRAFDPTGGKAAGGILRTLAGLVNVPHKGAWGARFNAVLDAFLFEVSEILEENADRPIEEILKDDALMARLNAKAEDFFNKNVWLVNEQVHDDKNCTIFATLARKETRKGKDGKEYAVDSKFPVTELPLARALKEKLDFCPKCFPAGSPAGAHAAERKEPAKKKASPADICGQYVLDAKDDEERARRADRVDRLWKLYGNVVDQELADRLDGLNTPAELEMLLLAADKNDQAAFNAALMRLEEPGMVRSASRTMRGINRMLEKKIDEINAACEPARARVREDLEAARRKRDARKGRSLADAVNPPGPGKRAMREIRQFFADLFSSLA